MGSQRPLAFLLELLDARPAMLERHDVLTIIRNDLLHCK